MITDDLISRQAAIDALHMHLMYRMGTDSNKKRLDEWINNLPSAQPEQQWTPCSERLPEKEGNYLITAQPTYNHAKDIRIAHWSSRWVGYVKSEIIAWMPLLESYKERLEE